MSYYTSSQFIDSTNNIEEEKIRDDKNKKSQY